MKQLPLPAHPVFPSRLDSIAALPELLRSRQIGCVLVIGDAHAVDCESLLSPCWRTAKSCTQSTPPCLCRTARTAR